MLSKVKIRYYAFLAGFWVLVLYNFHRYIFKYNSENTSPTYSNTPVIWQVAKYAIVAVILVIFYTGLNYSAKITKSFVAVYLMVGVVLVINIMAIVYYGGISQEVQMCFWFLIAAPYWFAKQTLGDLKINYSRLITSAAVILFASNGIAIANYYLTGRLPALGYEGSLIRYGGFWDDPNGYGIICVFFFFYFIGRNHYILAGLAIINILYTFSFSSYILLIAGTLFNIFPTYKSIDKRWFRYGILIFGGVIGVILYKYQAIMDIVEIKKESIAGHLGVELTFNSTPLENTTIQFSENWFKSLFYNYFPFSVIIEAGILVFALSFFTDSKYRYYKLFLLIIILSFLFFSTLYVFPLNILFVFILADYCKLRRRDELNKPKAAAQLQA